MLCLALACSSEMGRCQSHVHTWTFAHDSGPNGFEFVTGDETADPLILLMTNSAYDFVENMVTMKCGVKQNIARKLRWFQLAIKEPGRISDVIDK